LSTAWGPTPPSDPELEELFGTDPDLLRIAARLRESRPEPALDPRFHAVLRARLMREAQTVLAPRPSRFHLRRFRPAAWGTLAAAAALAAAIVATLVPHPAGPSPARLAATSPVMQDHHVDPHQTILVRFSAPMNTTQTAGLARQLKIVPATAFTLAWKTPTTLAVTPLHALATNTDYQVVIPPTAVHSQAGQTLKAPVTISFGTIAPPSPSPTPSPTPTLTPSVVGSAGNGSNAFWGPGGTPAETVSSGGAVMFPPGSAAVSLSSAPASAAALSPNEYYLALSIPAAGGGDSIVYEDPRSSAPAASAHRVWPGGGAPAESVTELTWANNYEIVFATASGIDAVNVLNGHTSVMLAFPSGGSGKGVALSPGGGAAFVPAADITAPSGSSPSAAAVSPAAGLTSPGGSANSGQTASPLAQSTPLVATPAATPLAAQGASPSDGWLVTGLGGSGQPTAVQLAGSAAGVVAFSGDGAKVAWVAAAGETSQVRELTTSDPAAPPAVLPGASGSGAVALALNGDGSVLAESLDPGGTLVIDTASVLVLGTAPETPTSLAFSADGSRLASISSGNLEVTPVGSKASAPASACAGADLVLSELVSAQVSGSAAQLAALSAPGAGVAATPSGLSRGYVVSAGCASTGSTLTASARLIVDPSTSTSGQFTDETVVLGKVSGAWLATRVTIPPLREQGGGPKVLTITVTPPASGMPNPESLVTVSFDSDLDSGTVNASSLWITGPDGSSLTPLSGPTYDPETRQATFTVAGRLPAGSSVMVGTSIADIDGGHPASQVSYPIGG
jgi:hypothetical protein